MHRSGGVRERERGGGGGGGGGGSAGGNPPGESGAITIQLFLVIYLYLLLWFPTSKEHVHTAQSI